jgi:LPXTG-motif cell wall-anchored protein
MALSKDENTLEGKRRMNGKKLLSLLLAVVLCVSLPLCAFAAPEEESSGSAQIMQEEESSAHTPIMQEDESSKAASEGEPDKDDVIAAIIRLLGSSELKTIKDALNNINVALGLPRVDDYTDIAAYADALYEKLDALGLGYDEIINAVTSSELIDWVNSILFPSDEQPSEKTANDKGKTAGGRSVTSPKTGISYSAAGAAAVTLLLSLGVVVLLKKRGIYAE